MWSHVIVSQAVLETFARLTGDQTHTYRLHVGSTTADQVSAGLPVGAFYSDTLVGSTAGFPNAGNPFTAADGTIWLPGAVRTSSGIYRYYAAKWNPATETIDLGWQNTMLDSFSDNAWSGIRHAWPRPGGGLIVVSISTNSAYPRVILDWPGTGNATISDPAHPAYFLRSTGPISGDRYAAHALVNNTDPAFLTIPYLRGNPRLVFRQAGQWWAVAEGTLGYLSTGGNPNATRPAYGLWTASGSPQDSEAWDLQTAWSGYALNDLGVVSGADTDYGDGQTTTSLRAARSADQAIAVGTDVFIGTVMARDTATAGRSGPADATCIRRMDSSGVLHSEFALPAPSYSGTHHHFGAMGTYQGDLYAATLEGWDGATSFDFTLNATLVLWKRGSGGTWSEVSHWTRTRAAFGSPLIVSLLEIGTELCIGLDSPKAWSSKAGYGLMCWSAAGGWREDTQLTAYGTMVGAQGTVLARLFRG